MKIQQCLYVENSDREYFLSGKESIFLLCMFCLAFLVHLRMYSYVLKSNNDDIGAYRAALVTRDEGLSGYLRTANDLARTQGRFFYLYTYVLTQIPYWIDSELPRASLLSLVFCLAGLCVTLFILKISHRKTAALLFFVLYGLSFPIYWRWHAYSSWPMYWKIPIIVFVVSQWLYWKMFYDTRKSPAYRWLPAYFLFAFSSISFGESILFVFGVAALISFVVQEHRRYGKLAWSKAFLVRGFLQYSPYLVYAVCWYGFLKFQGGKTRIGDVLSFNFELPAVVKTIWLYVVNSFPVNETSVRLAREYASAVLSQSALGEPSWLFSEFVLTFLVAAGLSIYVSRILFGPNGGGISIDNKADGKDPGLLAALVPVLVSLFLAVCSVAIYSCIAQCQYAALKRPWYTPTYYTSIFTILAFSFLLGGCMKRVCAGASRRAKTVARVAFVCIAPFYFSLVGFSNGTVHTAQEEGNVNVWLCRKLSMSRDVVSGKGSIGYYKSYTRIGGKEFELMRRMFHDRIDLVIDNRYARFQRERVRRGDGTRDGSGPAFYSIEVVQANSPRESFMRIGRMEALIRDGSALRPVGSAVAVVGFSNKPWPYITARAAGGGEGGSAVLLASETKPTGTMRWGYFKENVFLDTVQHLDFLPRGISATSAPGPAKDDDAVLGLQEKE
jgi:hypothetical protein